MRTATTIARILGGRRRMAAVVASVMLASLVPGGAAEAQEPNQVTGLTATQDHGFTTLRWSHVEGATDYEIERTPANDADEPTGTAVIVGLWRPARQVARPYAAFADAGYNPGDRFRWRVRARFGTTPQPYSEPVFGTTLPQWGDPSAPGEGLRTGWETSQAAQYTGDTDEYDYTAAVAAASDRVRVVEIGRTVLDRPINMFIIGYPQPPPTADAVADANPILVNCNVHGNEPSSREACLIMARELAFGNDPRTIDRLSNMTVLLVPAINGDGRALNTRGNSTGQDLNRDFSLISQPETFAFVQMLRDYRPHGVFDGHEFGNSNAGDLPILPPRHLNVADPVFDEAMHLMEGWMYEHGSDDGWWYCPYGCQGGGSVGLSQETILRNYLGLRSIVGQLLEARSSGGPTRPNEGNTQNNRRRKTYSALYTYHRFLDYYRERQATIQEAVETGVEIQSTNLGRIVFRGSRPVPAHPAPHPGQAPPPNESPSGTIENPPCGYELTELQYSLPQPNAPTVAERLEAHGIQVVERDLIPGVGVLPSYIVPMAQPMRGLIPLILDGQAAEPMTAGTRIACDPSAEVSPEEISASAPQGGTATETLTIGNTDTREEQTLSWTIEEAEASCSDTSDLEWLGVSRTYGATAPSSSTPVDVTLDAAGLGDGDSRSGLLCLSTNDPDRELIEVPVTVQVGGHAGGFGGFLNPVANPPAVNEVAAGSSVPMRFSLGGDRGTDILAEGSPASQGLDCATLTPVGPREPTSSVGNKDLRYDSGSDTYAYQWKTSSLWMGTCRQFVLTLKDGGEHLAYFRFR